MQTARPRPGAGGSSQSRASATSPRSASRSASRPRTPGHGGSPGPTTLRRRISIGSRPRRCGRLVELRFAGEDALGRPEAPERAGRRGVRVDRPAGDLDGGDAIRPADPVGGLAADERRVLGVGAGVEEDLRPPAAQPAVSVEGAGDMDDGAVAPGREDRFVDRQGELHRPPGPQGEGRGQRLDLGVALAAVAAADVRHDHPDPRERQVEAAGQVVADHERMLARGPDGQPAGAPLGDGGVGLHRVGVREWVAEGRPRGRGWRRRRPPRCRPIAGSRPSRRSDGRADVLLEAPVRSLLGRPLVDDRRTGRQGRGHGRDDGQRLVLDGHERQRLVGRRGIVGHDSDDRLAGVADDAVGDQGMIGQGVAVVEARRRPRSAALTTATTPGRARAAAASIERIRACG